MLSSSDTSDLVSYWESMVGDDRVVGTQCGVIAIELGFGLNLKKFLYSVETNNGNDDNN